MKTVKQSFKMELLELLDESLANKTLDLIVTWLEHKPTIPKTLCNQFCGHACRLCLLDDALSKFELLEDLKQTVT
jgi:hypothetical protein